MRLFVYNLDGKIEGSSWLMKKTIVGVAYAGRECVTDLVSFVVCCPIPKHVMTHLGVTRMCFKVIYKFSKKERHLVLCMYNLGQNC